MPTFGFSNVRRLSHLTRSDRLMPLFYPLAIHRAAHECSVHDAPRFDWPATDKLRRNVTRGAISASISAPEFLRSIIDRWRNRAEIRMSRARRTRYSNSSNRTINGYLIVRSVRRFDYFALLEIFGTSCINIRSSSNGGRIESLKLRAT